MDTYNAIKLVTHDVIFMHTYAVLLHYKCPSQISSTTSYNFFAMVPNVFPTHPNSRSFIFQLVLWTQNTSHYVQCSGERMLQKYQQSSPGLQLYITHWRHWEWVFCTVLYAARDAMTPIIIFFFWMLLYLSCELVFNIGWCFKVRIKITYRYWKVLLLTTRW